MNLGEMRDMVGTILDYDPEVQTYQDEVTDVINQIYMDFFSDRRWQFGQKLVNLTARADRTIATGGYNGGSGTATADILIQTATNFFENWMEGQVISITGGTAIPASPTDTQVRSEYNIQKVVSATQALLGSSAFTGTQSANGNATFTVKSRFLDLPYDTIAIMSMGVRDIYADTGPYANLTKHLDELFDVDLDQTGRPNDWVRYEDETMPHPRVAPTLVISAGAPAVPLAGTYQIKYTYIHRGNGRESAPSPASIATTYTGGQRADVADMQDSGANSGLYKQIYVKTPESSAYYAVTNALIDEATKTATGLVVSAAYLTSSKRAPEHAGHLMRVRLYPRQSSDLKVQLRYLYRPPMMLDDADVPQFPSAHHRYLVYRACQELFVKHSNLQHSEMYRRKADKELFKIQQRHLTEGTTSWIKRGYRETELYTAPTPSLTTLG